MIYAMTQYEFYYMNEKTVSKLKFTRQSMHRLNDELEILYQTTCIKIDLPNMDLKGRYDAEFSKYLN